jgi:hypothetical protein
MAKKAKSSRSVATRRTQHETKLNLWLTKEIGLLLLSVAVILVVFLFRQQSDGDAIIDHSIWSEVYMPDKYGVGVIAKRNISVSFYILIRVSPLTAFPAR